MGIIRIAQGGGSGHSGWLDDLGDRPEAGEDGHGALPALLQPRMEFSPEQDVREFG